MTDRQRVPLARYGSRRQILSPWSLTHQLAAQIRGTANLVDAIAAFDHRFAGLAARLRHAADIVDQRHRRDDAEPARGPERPDGDQG